MIKLCDTLLTKMVIGNTVILLYQTAEPYERKKIGKICALNTLFITRFRLRSTVLHHYIYDNIVRQQKVTNYIQGKSEKKL